MLCPNRYYLEFANACSKNILKDCSKYFKKYDPELPRITTVLGILKSINPVSVLDVGSGRGRSLWPMVNMFPYSNFTCVDINSWRCEVINAVNAGGIKNVKAINNNILDVEFNKKFDVITVLEVLEHIPWTKDVLKKLIALSKKFIIITVPSKPDNNPEHIHLFNKKMLVSLIRDVSKQLKKPALKIQAEHAGNSLLILVRF